MDCDSIFARWEREDTMRREYSFGAVILEAAAMARNDPWQSFSSRVRRACHAPIKGIASPVPTSKRAKVKAARKANRRRMSK